MKAISALIALLLQGGAPTSEPRSNALAVDLPDSFEVGHRQRADDIELVELIEPPETVLTWTRMVTLLAFRGQARRFTPDGYYEVWRPGLVAGCVGFSDRPIRGTVDARPAMKVVINCPRAASTGRPEPMTAFIVQGPDDLMIVQVAHRGTVEPSQDKFVERVEAGLKVCGSNEGTACGARRGTGFVAAEGD